MSFMTRDTILNFLQQDIWVEAMIKYQLQKERVCIYKKTTKKMEYQLP